MCGDSENGTIVFNSSGNPTGGNPPNPGPNNTTLTNTPGVFDAFSAWSPGGQQIVFSTNRDVNFEIYTMSSLDGSGLARRTFTSGGGKRPPSRERS